MDKMSDDEINDLVRRTVKETVMELRKHGLLKRADDVAYSEISNRLYEFYENPDLDRKLGEALDKIRGDYYFDIIPQYYRHKVTIDWIAEGYHCETSTITRNKKRLCLRLYSLVT